MLILASLRRHACDAERAEQKIGQGFDEPFGIRLQRRCPALAIQSKNKLGLFLT
jgi:hypothetical protein